MILLSDEKQLLYAIGGLACLFLIVYWNSHSNKRKRYDRKKRDFKANYLEKKINKE